MLWDPSDHNHKNKNQRKAVLQQQIGKDLGADSLLFSYL